MPAPDRRRRLRRHVHRAALKRLLRPGETTVMVADHRTYHLLKLPAVNRRLRVVSDFRLRKRKKMTAMLTAAEQQELHEIEQELRDTDCGFAWRLAAFECALRWSAPGRRVCPLAMAVLAAALAWLAAAAGRLLLSFAEGGMFAGPAALVIPCEPARPGREPGQAPGRHNGTGQP